MRHQLQPFQPPGLLAPERHLSCFDSQSTRRHRDQYRPQRSEEHTSELQSLMRISYAVFCLKKKPSHRPPTLHRNVNTLDQPYTVRAPIKMHYEHVTVRKHHKHLNDITTSTTTT